MPAIPAEPFPFLLDERRVALVVIDMQRDFLEPGGFGEALGNDVRRLARIVPTVAQLLALARTRRWPVVHTREGHRPDLADCPESKLERGNPPLRIGERGPMGRLLIRGEPGWEIVPELSPLSGELVIDKPGKGMFYATDLEDRLHRLGVRQLVVAGVTTEVCVQTSLREANDRGFDCLLVRDATASYFPQFEEATFAMITSQGAIVGWTTTSAALAEALA